METIGNNNNISGPESVLLVETSNIQCPFLRGSTIIGFTISYKTLILLVSAKTLILLVMLTFFMIIRYVQTDDNYYIKCRIEREIE